MEFIIGNLQLMADLMNKYRAAYPPLHLTARVVENRPLIAIYGS